jgi:hypothetical protein
MKMDAGKNVNIIRGWPLDGSLDRVETIKSGVTLVNGDWVVKQADNTVDKATTSKAGNAGLVIQGNGDSGSGAATGKAVVLWGNFIAQIKNLPSAVTFTPGAYVTIQKDGTGLNYLALGTFGTDPIVGVVLDVIANSAVNDASIIVKFN